MGDTNSPCYIPLQDVVIPPRTCLSPKLYETFGDISQVAPARQRTVLATFKGKFWGTGGHTRRKVVCGHRKTSEVFTPKLITDHPLPSVWSSYGDHGGYMEILNQTIFCPLPEGTAGWSTRVVDVIYAGCIPVFIGHSTQYPFVDIFDYSKFSITLERHKDLERLEEVLLAIPIDEVERLQANVMLIRDAFVYPLDGRFEDSLSSKGPLFFAMHSTKMRLLTKYPSGEMVGKPGVGEIES
jgi:hypothetical protein